MSRILLVDGTPGDRDRARDLLSDAGHEITCAPDATTAVDRLQHRAFDLVLADTLLRDMSGIDLARHVRQHENGRLARVILLSNNDDASAVARALDGGIDDYLAKPLRDEELLARVHAALRRPPAPASDAVLSAGPLRLDRVGHKVTVGEHELTLAPIEFRLMAYFMENQGRVLARRHLLDQVWRRRTGIGERTVDVHVRRLRAALEPHGCEHLLQTIRGFGYRFG